MNTYSMEFVAYKIDDKQMLKILSPIFIWGISIFVLLALVCNTPKDAAIITVPLMFIGFFMIIPIFIKMYKNPVFLKQIRRLM